MGNLALKLLSAAAVLVAFTWAVQWSWQTLRPLWPVGVVGLALYGCFRWLRHRQNYW